MDRPTWQDTFMEVAHVVARRSTCLRRQVGAVLVRDNRILATGYNGAPAGLPHCNSTGCLREQLAVPSGERHELCRAIHAEQNVIIQAALHGVTIAGSTLYVTCQPCFICAKILVNAGIQRIIYEGAYPDEMTQKLIADTGVSLEIYIPNANTYIRNEEIRFAEWVKQSRETKKMSLTRLAKLLGFSSTYIWKIETDKAPASEKFLHAWATTFGEPTVFLAAGRTIPFMQRSV